MPESTPSGKVVVYETSTGERLERWPVDARDMIRQSEYTYEPPSGARSSEDAEGGDPVPQDDASVAPVEPVEPAEPARPELTIHSTEHPSGGALKIAPNEPTGPAAPIKLPTTRKPRSK